jgi:hypothetical protein
MVNAAGRRQPGALRLWLGYLPLVLVASLVAAMVAFVPSEVPDTTATAGSATEVGTGQTASGWNDTVTPCSDREQQVEGDTYSPPCFAFEGDNGGETSRGVSADAITVAYRMTSDPNLLKVLADIAGIPFDETNEDIARTAEGLVDYFNQNFQLYGRRLVLERVEGHGSILQELTGGGQEAANNDAVKVAQDTQAFADITGATQPYADALSRQQVVNIGAPYMSRQWFQERRPYAWSNLSDCTVVTETGTEHGLKRIDGHNARWAGGELANRERRTAPTAPANQEYQRCADLSEEILAEGGAGFESRQDYVMDLSRLQTQAVGLLSQLRAAEITTVTCACDPLTMLYLAQQAEQQRYYPEWHVLGVGFIDLDLTGQMINKMSGSQWTRAFGASPWGAAPAPRSSPAYQAYKSVRQDEPSLLVDLVYFQLYELVIGIQMAGPELTPDNFETGMFAYPGGTGTAGHWDFSPEHYTGVRDAREVWWDPNAISPFNGLPGAYVDNGTRYEQGELTEGEPEVFGTPGGAAPTTGPGGAAPTTGPGGAVATTGPGGTVATSGGGGVGQEPSGE